ncbi:hypothetical protein [Agromyces ramosus]|uniref:hypothetical protein n=1 Tax=Agromyces ramosus TaxID=33879 RepID=UPI0027D8997F|nr:hypothetical protein [Agromyces ramosus]
MLTGDLAGSAAVGVAPVTPTGVRAPRPARGLDVTTVIGSVVTRSASTPIAVARPPGTGGRDSRRDDDRVVGAGVDAGGSAARGRRAGAG